MKGNYYEAHITIDPFETPEQQTVVEFKCGAYGFRIADLYMKKGEKHVLDAFMTTRSFEYGDIQTRTVGLVKSLQSEGIKIRRYKIELTLMDSRGKDELELLCTTS